MKKMQKPRSKAKNKLKLAVAPASKIASGSKCKKAPPIKLPAANATRISRILFNNFSFKNKVSAPIKAIKLIKNVLINIDTNILFFAVFFIY
jgi:hypothetical protein